MNERGYYENLMIAEVRYRMGIHEGMDRKLIHDLLIDDGYRGGPWLVKHSPVTWWAWRQFQPKFIFVRRPQQAIVESRIRCGHPAGVPMTEAEHKIAVATDIAIMDNIEAYIGGMSVWPDDFFKNRWHDLERAFEYCGLRLDREKAAQQIDPALWHSTLEAA